MCVTLTDNWMTANQSIYSNFINATEEIACFQLIECKKYDMILLLYSLLKSLSFTHQTYRLIKISTH